MTSSIKCIPLLKESKEVNFRGREGRVGVKLFANFSTFYLDAKIKKYFFLRFSDMLQMNFPLSGGR